MQTKEHEWNKGEVQRIQESLGKTLERKRLGYVHKKKPAGKGVWKDILKGLLKVASEACNYKFQEEDFWKIERILLRRQEPCSWDLVKVLGWTQSW